MCYVSNIKNIFKTLEENRRGMDEGLGIVGRETETRPFILHCVVLFIFEPCEYIANWRILIF